MKKPFTMIAALAVLGLAACSDYPVFSELGNSRLRVVIKGTFESNGPADWDLTSPLSLRDDSIDDKSGDTTVAPTEFMLDIAEMRLQGSGESDKFAFYRETYSVPLIDAEPFFDGSGVEFPCDDPYSNYQYTTLLVYIRKMIFNSATNWLFDYSSGTWVQQDEPDVIFREREVYGFDFNQLQYITFWDSLRTNSNDILHIFPLRVYFPPGGFVFDRRAPETVLEVRLVVKNFIKYFEHDYNSSGNYYVMHYWGLSDWLRDVKADDPVVGGNILAVARSYVPGRTAKIEGNATGNRFVIAIEESDTIDIYKITLPDRPDVSGDCEQPKPPTILDSNNIEAVLDYYIEYESYKKNLNGFITGCIDTGKYEELWDSYNSTVSNFRIPPLATISDSGGAYTITNVPVGKTYKVFVADSVFERGKLPAAYNSLGTVTFSGSDAGVSKSPSP